ncbi:MAG: sulfotransferase family protein [Bacteroidota bacterium]
MMSSKKHDLIPDFLIIGAGKSGTTSLDNYLKQHPQIFVPSVKEPNFFGYENTKIEDFKGNQEEINHYRGSVTDLQTYLDLFKNAAPRQVKGETSNTYMYHPEAPARIKHYNPDMKLIAVLRQPAGRLYSRFLHLARENRLPTAEFKDCLNKNTIWWQRNDLIKEGFYFRNLKSYYELFPKENIRVYLYEEFNDKTEEVLKDIYRFLGVDENYKTDLSVKYNQSGFIKNKFLDNIYGQRGLINKTVKAIFPKSVIEKLKGNVALQRKLNDLRGKNLAKPKLDPEIRYKLTHEVYGEDIQNLQELIGKDLSHWLTSKNQKV